MSVTLCYSPGSCSLAPHIVLNEIGQPFVLRRFATAEREHRSPEYLAINPKGRIPALQIDGFILTENPAILAYLGRRHPEAGLYPTDAREPEARCLELLAWSSNTVHVAYAQLFRPERFVLDARDHAAVKASGRENFERCLVDIERKLQQQAFAVGPAYTVVDPFWLVFYRWGTRSGYDMKGAFRAFTDFASRLCERPAVQRALATEGISVWE